MYKYVSGLLTYLYTNRMNYHYKPKKNAPRKDFMFYIIISKSTLSRFLQHYNM